MLFESRKIETEGEREREREREKMNADKSPINSRQFSCNLKMAVVTSCENRLAALLDALYT